MRSTLPKDLHAGEVGAMDPIANLEEQLAIAKALREAIDSGRPMDSGETLEDAGRLAELVLELDRWLDGVEERRRQGP
jgi:hypothetical protein